MTNDNRWRKSRHSGGSGGDCVEVGGAPGRVLVRDTKQAGRGPVMTFSAAAWRRFARELRER
jgi:hypothetical protein